MDTIRICADPGAGLTRRRVCGAILAAVLSGGACRKVPVPLPIGPRPHRTVEQATIESSFIVRGLVQRAGSTMPEEFAPDRDTFIVNVVETFTDNTRYFQGKNITVKVANYSRLKEGRLTTGREYIFLAQPLVYGTSIAVFAEPANSADVISSVRRRPDLILIDRLDGTDLVVSGTVVSVRPIEEREEKEGSSESDAYWQAAEVRVATAEKGRPPKPPERLYIAFPGARTFQWFHSPKFKVQQSGIWLLRRTRIGRRNFYTALYPLDFQPPSELERIRRLLGKGTALISLEL